MSQASPASLVKNKKVVYTNNKLVYTTFYPYYDREEKVCQFSS